MQCHILRMLVSSRQRHVFFTEITICHDRTGTKGLIIESS